ncbi:MAG TPA: phosphotransferase [Solirubrobacteraceae bacterium]|nr:phosphotransferase [Solirubrobacteraceae bacterium]
MPGEARRIIRSIDELDAAWLQDALGSGPIDSFVTEPIGTGQMSESHRVSLTYADPATVAAPTSVVLKLAAQDTASRATGVGLGIYAREVRFYDELGPRIGGPLPSCSAALFDESEGWFTLLLEDAADARPGDQIAGCSVAEAHLAMRALARLHAPVLGDHALAGTDWLNRPSPINQALVAQLLPGFLDRYDEHVSDEHRALCERFVARLDAWLADRRDPQGLVHGDFRLDNLLFGAPGAAKPLVVVDWQTVGWGGAVTDATYFLGGGLRTDDRRAHERELLGSYHEALLAEGIDAETLPWELCWEEYRRHAFAGVLMAIIAPMLVERTPRGDEMFMTMLARHAQHALDLEAEELLPAADSAPAAPLRPEPSDEGRHERGPEPLWNESWYFDAIAPDGSYGAWVRVGLYPNLGVCWYTALVCGPGRPTVAAVDFAAPLATGAELLVEANDLRAEHRCVSPLEHFALTLRALARSHEDPSAILRGEAGEPQELALDLSWQTTGEPYAYRLTTRYEIPCLVSGTIDVGGERLELREAPGQRDHSWGARDWWSMDWMWSAAHLSDDTHLHAVELRLPGMPTLGVGYAQGPGVQLTELRGVAAAESVGADGLIEDARLLLDPLGLEVELRPLAFAPLRLVADDGRVSHFPRAICAVRCSDGREGLAWVEWNLNQPR